jgi:NADH:ubiquinone oxidoreductase subunit C
MTNFLYNSIYGNNLSILDESWPSSVRNTFFNVLVCFNFIYITINIFKNKSNYQLKNLVDMFAYDLPGRSFRFGVVYIFLSHLYNFRLKLFTRLPEGKPGISSVSSLFASSFWLEREIWEFFGIFFKGHSDLRRLLTDYTYDETPKLRKEVSQLGYMDPGYSEVEEKLKLAMLISNQSIRVFNSNYIT